MRRESPTLQRRYRAKTIKSDSSTALATDIGKDGKGAARWDKLWVRTLSPSAVAVRRCLTLPSLLAVLLERPSSPSGGSASSTELSTGML